MIMNLEEIQKFLDDNNLTLEEYLLANIFSGEERKYWDNMWIDAIYNNLGEDTWRTGTGMLQVSLWCPIITS